MGLPLPAVLQNDDKAKTAYDDAKETRLFVQCGANAPIGTFPVQTDDNYRSFWIGFEDGTILRDNSDPSGNYRAFGDCPSGQSAEFCKGWNFGWYFDEAQINPPDPSDPKCYADSIKAPNLVGTWNILNVTNHHATSGIIVFTKDPSYKPYGNAKADSWNYTESINGQPATNGSWTFNDPTNTMVNLCPPFSVARPCSYLTFKVIEPNYMELLDEQNSNSTIIDLVRSSTVETTFTNTSTPTIVKTFVPIPFAPVVAESAAYNAGFQQGYELIPLRYHHTQDFILGHENGTSSYWNNRGQVEAENGMSPTSKDPDYMQGYQQGKSIAGGVFVQTLPSQTNDNNMSFYIGVHDGATQADSDNSKNNLGYHGCPAGHTKEFCDGYEDGYGEEGYLLHDD
jgi:hypothetical protein